jgi:hypothetical protein
MQETIRGHHVRFVKAESAFFQIRAQRVASGVLAPSKRMSDF